MNCGKQISTENGTLTCDLKAGHVEFHHASHPGGKVPYPDLRHSVEPTGLVNEKGDNLAGHMVEALDIEWPTESHHASESVKMTHPVRG